MAEGDDEIGQLGRAFNAMSRAIRDRLDALHASEQQLNLALDGGELGLWVTDFFAPAKSPSALAAPPCWEKPWPVSPGCKDWEARVHPGTATICVTPPSNT